MWLTGRMTHTEIYWYLIDNIGLTPEEADEQATRIQPALASYDI